MEELYNFVPFFYRNQGIYLRLLFIFQVNLNNFDSSLGLVNQLPSFFDIQLFFMSSCFTKVYETNFEFRNFFKKFKECWICLISMYEILHEKSFVAFVIIILLSGENTFFKILVQQRLDSS